MKLDDEAAMVRKEEFEHYIAELKAIEVLVDKIFQRLRVYDRSDVNTARDLLNSASSRLEEARSWLEHG